MSRYSPLLVVMALPVESSGVFESAGVTVEYTGIGKVNAAIALCRRLADYRHVGLAPPRVVNFGTAGSHRLKTGSLVCCSRFMQRDMDVSALGYSVGETPYEATPIQLQFEPTFKGLPDALCGTGDSFATSGVGVECDVLDMEAYALAKVCYLSNVGFSCAKYVTDGADHASALDWRANVDRAAHEFLRLYRTLG